MKRLQRHNRVYRLDRHDPPAVQVDPGETILVETADSLDGQLDLSRPGLVAVAAPHTAGGIDVARALPLTGPIYVRGADAGDVLVAEIVGLVATGNGFILPGFDRLLLGYPAGAERTPARIVELRQGKIACDERTLLPYILMVGALAVAPGDGSADTYTPGDYGGNHDCLYYGQGARLYLQVQAPGALVSLGDVHAAMGDAEVAGTAVECNAEVMLRFHLYKGERIPGPVLETPEAWMVYGHGVHTDEAIDMAAGRAVQLLMGRLALDRAGALMLVAAVGHLRLNEVVNPRRSARLEVPRHLVDPLLAFAGQRTLTEALPP